MYFVFFLYSIRFHILLEDVNFLVYIFLEITCTPDTLIKNFVYMLSQHFEINLDYTCDMLLFFVHLYSAAKYFYLLTAMSLVLKICLSRVFLVNSSLNMFIIVTYSAVEAGGIREGIAPSKLQNENASYGTGINVMIIKKVLISSLFLYIWIF